jgi:hypothetical protein
VANAPPTPKATKEPPTTTAVRASSTPTPSPYPAGATAICVDGSYSYSQTAPGTCSGQGGVKVWLKHIEGVAFEGGQE